jgi:hypothetical protein
MKGTCVTCSGHGGYDCHESEPSNMSDIVIECVYCKGTGEEEYIAIPLQLYERLGKESDGFRRVKRHFDKLPDWWEHDVRGWTYNLAITTFILEGHKLPQYLKDYGDSIPFLSCIRSK